MGAFVGFGPQGGAVAAGFLGAKGGVTPLVTGAGRVGARGFVGAAPVHWDRVGA
ncbi:hypothetical protein [Meiothermus sp.]|uniref:hypothetical protein n=1 Tax=Meiothermus sp. TaxID=1955249 RepID=UPI00260DCDD6|nr:hypothetical protein [Meiothermus sp.]